MTELEVRTCYKCGKEDARLIYVCEMPDDKALIFRFCSPECLKYFLEIEVKNIISEELNKLREKYGK